jgi:hypothetical protein
MVRLLCVLVTTSQGSWPSSGWWNLSQIRVDLVDKLEDVGIYTVTEFRLQLIFPDTAWKDG